LSHTAAALALAGLPGKMTPASSSQAHFKQAGSLGHARHLISVINLTSYHRSQCHKHVQGKGSFPCSHVVLGSLIAEIKPVMRVSWHHHEIST